MCRRGFLFGVGKLIKRFISERRQRVSLPILIGDGKVPACTCLQIVAVLMFKRLPRLGYSIAVVVQ